VSEIIVSDVATTTNITTVISLTSFQSCSRFGQVPKRRLTGIAEALPIAHRAA